MDSGSVMCISFWYHMKAATTSAGGTLSIVRYDLDSRTSTTMWTVKASTESIVSWKHGKVSYVDPRKHTIRFEAVRGSGLCDTAVDDIEFLPSTNCTIKPSEAIPPTTTTVTTASTTTTTTTFSPTTTFRPFNENDCDFETSFCKWVQPSDNFFNWDRLQGVMGKKIFLLI